ncbi:MAG: type II toxin-antitoxin system Phd/YefM family antitoxin [Planctomycetota bacterium]
MVRAGDIQPLSEFRQHATAHLDRLAQTRGIEILTVNGRPKGVVMSPEVFDELQELADEARIAAGIRRGLAELDNGDRIDAKDGLRQLATELGIRLDR